MKKQGGYRGNAKPVADYVSKLLSPVIERRAGMTMDLIAVWEEIVGEEHAHHSRPEKLNWPRQASDDDPFEPATLVIACEPAGALFLQHQTGSVIQRINTYFGFAAVARIKLVQKPIANQLPRRKRPKPPLTKGKSAKLSKLLEDVDDPTLRDALEKLGRGVFTSRSGGQS